MKHLLVLLLVVLLGDKFCFAQVNLVPNPSFEDTISCPNNLNELLNAKDWKISINTPDYYNACASNSSNVSVPNNAFGYQDAATGKAYGGFCAYNQMFPNSNEFLGTQLINPLVVGEKYYISFKVALESAQPNFACGIDKVGLLFTNIYLGDTVFATPIPQFLKNNSCHVYATSIISDTLNWTTIKGTFIADSAYHYFLIGHFFDSLHTSFNCLDNSNITNKFSYYLVDDVCITTDSFGCKVNSGITNNITTNATVIINNPVSNHLLLSVPIEIASCVVRVQITNIIGQELFNEKFFEEKIFFSDKNKIRLENN